jgi:hypothetical protein
MRLNRLLSFCVLQTLQQDREQELFIRMNYHQNILKETRINYRSSDRMKQKLVAAEPAI